MIYLPCTLQWNMHRYIICDFTDLLQVEQAESSALDELRAETLGPGASQVVSQIAQAKRRMVCFRQ